MPRLPSYEPGDLSLRPTETGVDAAAAAARRGGAFFNQKAAALNEQAGRLVAAARDIAGAQRGAAEGKVSIAQGEASIASGTAAAATGKAEEARGTAAYAEGTAAIAKGDAAFAQSVATGVKEAAQRIDEYSRHQEISVGSRSLVTAQGVLEKQLAEISAKADPNDRSVGQRFLEENVEASVQQWMDSFQTKGGQEWALGQANGVRQHFFNRTAAVMSLKAGLAVKQNTDGTVNMLADGVRNDPSPSTVGKALRDVDTMLSEVVASSPNLDATAKVRVHDEINTGAKRAIMQSFGLGVAEKNPAAIEPLLREGQYAEFFTPAERTHLITYARSNIRLAQSEANHARELADYKDRLEFHDAINKLELSTIPDDPTARPTLPPNYWQGLREASKLRGATLEPGRLKSALDNGDRLAGRYNKPEPLGAVSHETTMGLLTRMRASDDTRLTDNDEIYKAYGDGKLNNADFNFLTKEFRDLRTPEGEALGKRQQDFLAGVKPYMVKFGPLSSIDPSGSEQFFRFSQDLHRKVDEYRKAGKNPYDLMDPSKSDYMGGPANMQSYQLPMDKVLSNFAEGLKRRSSGGLPPAESITGVQNIPAPVATSVPRPPAPKPPEKGFIKDGYEFLGGNPGEAASWRKVGA